MLKDHHHQAGDNIVFAAGKHLPPQLPVNAQPLAAHFAVDDHKDQGNQEIVQHIGKGKPNYTLLRYQQIQLVHRHNDIGTEGGNGGVFGEQL